MIAWLPHSTNPVFAGARIRCLTPMRMLVRRGVPVELFAAHRANAYRVLIVQGLRCRPTPGDALTGDGLLDLVVRLRGQGCRIVVEDCDNHFYNPRGLSDWSEVAHRLRSLVGMADHLVASTRAMIDVFRRETGTTLPVALIGDAVEESSDLDFDPAWRRVLSWRRKVDWVRLQKLRTDIATDRLRGHRQLVWFGSHGASYADGGMGDLMALQMVLENLSRHIPLSLTVISNSRQRYDQLVRPINVNTRYMEWSRSTFLAALALHDVAVIPITRTPFTECKSNNRLLLSLNNGLAVCASRIDSYAEFDDVCELDNWEQGLTRYLTSREHAQAHVARARERIRDHWTAEKITDQWYALMHQLTAAESIPQRAQR